MEFWMGSERRYHSQMKALSQLVPSWVLATLGPCHQGTNWSNSRTPLVAPEKHAELSKVSARDSGKLPKDSASTATAGSVAEIPLLIQHISNQVMRGPLQVERDFGRIGQTKIAAPTKLGDMLADQGDRGRGAAKPAQRPGWAEPSARDQSGLPLSYIHHQARRPGVGIGRGARIPALALGLGIPEQSEKSSPFRLSTPIMLAGKFLDRPLCPKSIIHDDMDFLKWKQPNRRGLGAHPHENYYRPGQVKRESNRCQVTRDKIRCLDQPTVKKKPATFTSMT